MKDKKLFDALSFVDEGFIEDANPDKNPKKTLLFWKRLAYIAVAACLMLVIVLPILFMGEGVLQTPALSSSENRTQAVETPPGHLAQYQDSPYYPLIERLDAYYNKGSSGTVQKPSSSGTDQAEATEIVNFPLFPDETMMPDFGYIYSPDEPVFPNNMSEGVTEADLFAHTDTHIFYLKELCRLEAYSVNQTDAALVGNFYLEDAYCYNFHLLSGGNEVLFLARDNENWSKTILVYVDVSDPANMKEIKRVELSGHLMSSFQTDDSVLIYTIHNLPETPDFHEIASFVPTVTDGNRVTSLPCDNIIFPKSLTYAKYSVLYLFDAKTLAFEGGNAFLGEDKGEFYVYDDHVLVATTGNLITKTDGRYDFKGSTTIHYFPYGNGSFERKGVITIDGYLNTLYSLEEHDGILRVLTAAYYLSYQDERALPPPPPPPPPDTVETTADPFAEESPEMMADEGVAMLGWTEEELNYFRLVDDYSGANLYCISLESFEVVASLERFVPNGQPPQSMRFDGDLIYVTVDASFTNLVYTLDLSDLSHITCKKSAAVEEYYSYTLRYDEDTLLKIGYQNRWEMKIELLRETENGLISLDQYVKENVRLSSEYQLYYIDFDKKLFGLGFRAYQEPAYGEVYILFCFEGDQLVRLVDLNEEWIGYGRRVAYIDGYLYIFAENYIRGIKAIQP